MFRGSVHTTDTLRETLSHGVRAGDHSSAYIASLHAAEARRNAAQLQGSLGLPQIRGDEQVRQVG
eukprot:7175897-Pyramimonas_sp.AAC.1